MGRALGDRPTLFRAIAAQEAQQGEPWAAALLQLSAGLGPAPPPA